MRTQKQIDTSRANGHKSTGATTPQGKARIVAANLTSGIYAETEILPWEKPEDFEKLKAEYYAHHRATSPEARFLIDDLISCEWTLRRLRSASARILAYESSGLAKDLATFERIDGKRQKGADHIEALTEIRAAENLARLQTRINATRLAYHRALKDLQRLEGLEAQEPFAAEADELPADEPAAETAPATDPPENHLQTLGSLRKSPHTAPELHGPREVGFKLTPEA